MKAKAYYYKWKFIWIIWVLEFPDNEPVHADDIKTLTIESDRIIYFSLSLNSKSAFKKIKKFCERRYS